MENDQKQKSSKKKRDGPNRRARLIVRNLPFKKTTEQNLRELFEKYGIVDEVNLLKRPDGKLVGCAFIQYRGVQMATKALYHLSGKEFMGREIIIDWAFPKDKYVQENANTATDDVAIKEEPKVEESGDGESEPTVNTDVKIKEESESGSENDDKDSESNESASEDDDDNDDKASTASTQESKPDVKPRKLISNDVSEGKTVFIKNVPFTATNDDLKACMTQFGRVYYALICKDPFTEHSKGTAFVKFVEKEDADKCLQAGTELTLLGNILDCYPALDKKSLEQKKDNQNQKQKDSRNLYLIKEGVILAGSKAAIGVSKTDMEKRLRLEQWKSQILRNLHMFVSKNRLIIHNLPPSWDDKKLKALFLKHSGPKAVITEAKVMRNLKHTDAKGIGQSKEYGFVTFTNHDDALFALRAINNNPNIFTASKRPIVAFSIENRVMVNAKQKRLQKSRKKNPLCKEYEPDPDEDKKEIVQESLQNTNTSKVSKKNRKRKYPFSKNDETDENAEKFIGVTAKPDATIPKLRSKFKLQTQAKIHHENLKKVKKQKRLKMNLNQPRIKQPKQKMKKRKDGDDHFSKLVNKYKSSLVANSVKKSKWYD